MPLDQRPSGIHGTADLPWGSHFCIFYDSPRELLDVIVPFIKAGLDSNEFCLVEVSAALTREHTVGALREAIPGFPGYVSQGQLEIVSAPDDLLAQGPVDETIERRLDQAILAGFDGLRLVRHASVDATGQLLAAGAATMPRLNVLAAFLYPRAELGAVELMQIVQGHRLALVFNSGRWEVLEGSEARTIRDALERSQEKLQSLFRNMSEGFAYHRIVLDGTGQPCDYLFLEVSQAFERLTGLVASKVLGKRVTQVLPGIEADPTDWIGKYGRVALTGEPSQFESYTPLLDRWYAVSAFSPHRGYFAVTFSDITDRKRAEAAQAALIEERSRLLASEQSARSEAERANRLKDEFLANLSHELRTPLNAILGWTQILRRGCADADNLAKGLEVIERNTRIQNQLISDLLDISRIISGKMRLEVRNCDPAEALEAATDSVAPAAEAKKIRIEKMIEPLSGPVLADPDRLQQAFWNLLSNAIKFTPAGGRIQILMRRADSRIEVVFQDTGKGIPPEFLPRIFERFRQADPSTTKRHSGLGLGLAIVKNLIELHGGTIRAESPGEGQGATFTVCLPIIAVRRANEAGPDPISAEALGVEAITLRGIKVLFVDDEPDTREMVKRLLEEHGALVTLAESAAKGVTLVQQVRPDVLVGDIGMPGEDGYAMIRKIRNLPTEAGGLTPAIALTAYSRMEDRTRAMLAGYQYHLSKPVEAPELLATLGMITHRLRSVIAHGALHD